MSDLPEELACRKPVQDRQTTLWPEPRDRFLARAGVSVDDCVRWHQRGWLSFDVRQMDKLDTPETNEICFIRNLAWSFLSDEQMGVLLEDLEAPYAYHPLATVYSFALGWLQIMPSSSGAAAEDFIREHFAEWLRLAKFDERTPEFLKEIARSCIEALGEIDDREAISALSRIALHHDLRLMRAQDEQDTE